MSMAVTRKAAHRRPHAGHAVAFFGVIIAVNCVMACFANSTWSGLVVANGYVASQSFDKDLAKARRPGRAWLERRLRLDRERVQLTFADAKAGQKIDGLDHHRRAASAR